MRKLIFLLFFVLLIIPSAYASSNSDWWDVVDEFYDIADYFIEKIVEFMFALIQGATRPFLSLIETLLKSEVSITPFQSLWRSLAYVVSMFYGLLFLYAGLQFITSGNDPAKRTDAKTWLKNTFVMIVLVQASYYLYQLTMQISSALTTAILKKCWVSFFTITYDVFTNLSMEYMFITLYIIILLVTILLLAIRYIFASIGVVFAPIGIFLSFIPPLQSYGKLIINSLGIMAFIPFVDAIIILASSQLLFTPVFSSMQILVKIVAFLIIDFSTIMLFRLAVTKSAFDSVTGGVTKVIKYASLL
ncbi:MAG: hypothetical protein WC471_04335 [Candidatus Woesearchaeota archaeon]